MNDSNRPPHEGWQVLRGICMGAADVVPGVSGGTVALILGIYQRLVSAVSHFDLQLLKHLRRGRWRQAAAHIDLLFLMVLGGGIVLGVVGMALLTDVLLGQQPTRMLTLAAFFGMIFASAILVGRLVRAEGAGQRAGLILLGLVGAAVACWISLLRYQDGVALAPSYPYLFLCGAVAICAMILPGISGAMMLLLLGVYASLIEIPKNLLHGNEIGHSLTSIMVFGLGCACGLIAFSKLLRWLLERYHAATMAVLCGFMFGALPKLWPFQEAVPPFTESIKRQQFRPVMPEAFDLQVLATVVAALLAAAMVFVVDHQVRRRSGGQQDANSLAASEKAVDANG